MRFEKPKIYSHDYDGSCRPELITGSTKTFSVGIFQWLPKSSGNGLKRGPVKFRVKGHVSDAEKIYRVANYYCELCDRKWAIDPSFKLKTKSETIK